MTKLEKIAVLSDAMTQSKREDGTEFYHFTDKAPEELKSLYLEHYNVAELDYETFSQACDIVSEIYKEFKGTEKVGGDIEGDIIDEIYERSSDSASVYTSVRLGYLNNQNESDISDYMKEYGVHSIAETCAIWYDKQVEQQALIIKDWINI